MIDHEEINAYIDGEMEQVERRQFESKLRECCETQKHELAARNLKLALSTKCSHEDCSELWKVCRDRLDEIDRTKKVENFVGRYAWSIVAAFLFVIVGVAGFNRSGGPDLRTSDLPRIAAGLTELAGPLAQTPDEQRQWFNDIGRSDMQNRMPDFYITGGKSGKSADGKEVLVVQLQDATGPLSLISVSKTQRVEGIEPYEQSKSFYQTTVNNRNAVAWIEDGAIFFLVGDRNSADLYKAAQNIAQPSTN